MKKDEMFKIIEEIKQLDLDPKDWLEFYILSKHIKIPESDFVEGKKVFGKLYEVIKVQRELKKAPKEIIELYRHPKKRGEG